jgi:hypothetical protein
MNNITAYGYEFNKKYDTYVRNAKKRNIEFKITKENFENMVTSPCYYCGFLPENLYSKENKYNSKINGIDRINSSLGYIDKNIVSCCKICNRFKMDMSFEEFKVWIINIHKNKRRFS